MCAGGSGGCGGVLQIEVWYFAFDNWSFGDVNDDYEVWCYNDC